MSTLPPDSPEFLFGPHTDGVRQDACGIGLSAINRMLDPFYFGHSLSSLRKLVKATGARLEVTLK